MEEKKKGNFGWAVLGFFIPIVGLILFIVWKDERKADSKNAGIGALVGFIIGVILIFVLPALLINRGWKDVQNSLVDRNCKLWYSEEYKAVRKGDTWFCKNTITGEMIEQH